VFGDGRLLGHGSLSKLGKNATLVDMDDMDRQWEMEFFMGMGKDKELETEKDEELSDDNMDRSWECRIIARVLATPGSAPTGGWSGWKGIRLSPDLSMRIQSSYHTRSRTHCPYSPQAAFLISQ